MLIHTDDSLPHAQRGAELAGVDRDLLRFRQVDKADSASVYRHIRDAIQGDRSGVVIDFTSGTKAMTAAASAAAGYLGVAQVYIESTYLRPGYFGRELVHVVDHPLVIFGDAKREEAERFYAQGAWAPAEQLFKDLDQNRVPDFHFAARVHICTAYREMEALRFEQAHVAFAAARDSIASARKSNASREPLLGLVSFLALQADAASKLVAITRGNTDVASDAGLTNLLCRFLVSYARRRMVTEPDLAALLNYRVCELSLQRRIAARGYAASAFSADDQFWAAFDEAVIDPKHRIGDGARPDRLGLAQIFTALRALRDPIATEVFRNPREFWGKVDARNASIYAHGFRTMVGDKKAQDFAEVACRLARAVAEADGLELPDSDDSFDPVPLSV